MYLGKRISTSESGRHDGIPCVPMGSPQLFFKYATVLSQSTMHGATCIHSACSELNTVFNNNLISSKFPYQFCRNQLHYLMLEEY
jgi:hypothetical protein